MRSCFVNFISSRTETFYFVRTSITKIRSSSVFCTILRVAVLKIRASAAVFCDIASAAMQNQITFREMINNYLNIFVYLG